jgi:ubiquitin-protein ligase
MFRETYQCTVAISIRSFLTDPNPYACHMNEIGELLLNDPAAYEENVRNYTTAFAMHNKPTQEDINKAGKLL